MAQLVARYLGVVEAASSSLVTQTKKRDSQESRFFFILQGFLALFDFKKSLKKGIFFECKKRRFWTWYNIWYNTFSSLYFLSVEV